MSARLPDDASAALDLRRVTSRDEDEARAAFERLWAATSASILKRMRRLGLPEADAEDLAQTVAQRLWVFRDRLRATTRGEWYSFVRVTSTRALADHWAGSRPDAPLEDAERIEADEIPYLDALIVAAEGLQNLYDGADRLWLGEVNNPTYARIGAATLLAMFVGELPPLRAAAMFGASLADVDRWLEDDAVLGRAVFRALCWPGDALAGYVLRPDQPLRTAELDRLAGLADSPWSGFEARVVVWRARNAMREDQIIQAAGGDIGAAALERILVRYRESLPFQRIVERILAVLEDNGKGATIESSGLWKRIAFEYATRDELPHLQIVERAGPAADRAKMRIDGSTLNNWLSMGRLYAQLAAYLQREER